MKKNVRTKVMGTVLAALCAVSVATATVGSVSAAVSPSASVSVRNSCNRGCKMDFKGVYNWTYSLDACNIINLTCDFNLDTHKCTFYAEGVNEGEVDAVLMTLRADGYWNNTPVHFDVDSNLNVTGYATGRTYVTAYV